MINSMIEYEHRMKSMFVTKDRFYSMLMILTFVSVISLSGWIIDTISINLSIFQTSQLHKEQELRCLAENIYHEARGEPLEGKIAVAQVVLNRVESTKFPDSICDVVYQKSIIYGKTFCQFSWFCNSMIKNPEEVNPVIYQEILEIAKKVMQEDLKLPLLGSALYFHASRVNPKWKKKKITKIGNHVFYE